MLNTKRMELSTSVYFFSQAYFFSCSVSSFVRSWGSSSESRLLFAAPMPECQSHKPPARILRPLWTRLGCCEGAQGTERAGGRAIALQGVRPHAVERRGERVGVGLQQAVPHELPEGLILGADVVGLTEWHADAGLYLRPAKPVPVSSFRLTPQGYWAVGFQAVCGLRLRVPEHLLGKVRPRRWLALPLGLIVPPALVAPHRQS